ncbi:Hypothetical protein DHA2_15076 [Giardia duodenalis]|uniref:Annexin n=1 Tax=Giardia intestinalis TaxID=5741 RepID=V6TIY1_GIAIN|nr:Hypothetical protein DHA2_15076 [Giardia intestinalis]
MTSITQLCNDLYDALNGHAIKDSVVIKLCCSVPQHTLVQVALRYQAMTGCSLEQILTTDTESNYRRILARLCMRRQLLMLNIIHEYIVTMSDKRIEPAVAIMHLGLVLCTLSKKQLYELVVAYKQQYFSDITEDIYEILRKLSPNIPDSNVVSRIFISLLSCARDDDSFDDYGDVTEKRSQLLSANASASVVGVFVELLCGRSVTSIKALEDQGFNVKELLTLVQQKGLITGLAADLFLIVFYSCIDVHKMWAHMCNIAIESKNSKLLADTILIGYDQSTRLREEYAALKGTYDISVLQNVINGDNPDHEQIVFNALIETGANLK